MIGATTVQRSYTIATYSRGAIGAIVLGTIMTIAGSDALARRVAPGPDVVALSTARRPYIAVNTKLPSAYPEASNRGRFLVVNNCLVLKRAGDGLLLTPVFPKHSTIVPHKHGARAILVRGKKVPLGKILRLGGGYFDSPTGGDISLQRPVPSTCPTPFWLVGNIMIK